ncbi:MAG: hypothetical protein PHQ00_02705 [Phycisphaerae bacterium]|nr:hypothetical protein [Phycisphaerae bacterium]
MLEYSGVSHLDDILPRQRWVKYKYSSDEDFLMRDKGILPVAIGDGGVKIELWLKEI